MTENELRLKMALIAYGQGLKATREATKAVEDSRIVTKNALEVSSRVYHAFAAIEREYMDATYAYLGFPDGQV